METCLISNPPYNLKWKYPQLVKMLPQYCGWTLPPESNANFAFVLSGLSKVSGKAVFLLPCGVLSTSNKNEVSLKKEILENNLLSAVITLPDNMFESTSIPTCLLLFDRQKQTRKIEMIDMRKTYEIEVRDQNGQFGGTSHENRTYHKEFKIFSNAQIQAAVAAIKEQKDEEGFCRAVSPEEIKKNEGSLVPSVYIELKPEEPEHRPFQDIAEDYNRIVKAKNAIHFTVNETAARRMGIPVELYKNLESIDLSESFKTVGCKAEKENFMNFTKSAVIKIEINTNNGIPYIIQDLFREWALLERELNDEQNRVLAEFRDALLPELMSGKIELPQSPM